MAGSSSACAANAQSSPCQPASMLPWSMSYRPGSYLSPEDLLLVKMAGCSSPQESGPTAKAIAPYWPSLQPHLRSPLGWSQIPNCNETLSPSKDGDDESERVPASESD